MHSAIVLKHIYACCLACISELSLISLHWFLTLFASVVHMKVLLRLWDLFFYEGSTVLFQMTIGMLKMKVMDYLDGDYLDRSNYVDPLCNLLQAMSFQKFYHPY